MIQRLAAALALLSAALLASPSLAQGQAQAPKQHEQPGRWAQDYVNRAVDPDVRFGTLPNGMRYAIQHNSLPPGTASFRLHIAAGSLDERDDQKGLAHFLEHMAFKGSAKAPGDAMIKTLERMGLAFGADTNASTSWDETVYKLDLPRSDKADLDTALMLLRQQASELTLAQSDMDPERGVVLSEERLRDSPGYEVAKAYMGFELEGQRPPAREPIGDPHILQTAPVSRIREFYDAWYRPQNATLVVVGDFDAAAMEAAVKAAFADWRGRGSAPTPPPLGAVERRAEAVRVETRPGAPQSIQIDWVAPYDDQADTFEHDRTNFVQGLALAVLNRRLASLGEQPDPPFIAAASSRQSVFRAADITTLGVNTTEPGWRRGLAAVLTEQRRLQRFGVTQAELDREITDLRAAYTLAATAGRRSPQIADAIVHADQNNDAYTSPRQSLAEFERMVKGLTAAEVSASVTPVFAGSGPLVFVSSPKPVEGGEAAVRAVLAQAQAAPLAPYVAKAAVVWPYAHFGAPATVAERRDLPTPGVTFVRLSNGVRLTVKSTKLRPEQILVSVRFGQGRLGLPQDRPSPLWALSSAVVNGGTQELTSDELQRAGVGKLAAVGFSVGDDSFGLSGATRPQDFDYQMQLLCAYLTRPGFRPEALARAKASMGQLIDQIDSTPEGVVGRDYGQLTHTGDLRWRSVPTRAELDALTTEQVRALVAPHLAQDPLSITIVGDVSVERAIAVASATFGALPPRREPAKPAPAAYAVAFPGPGGVERLHHGRADQAVALAAWPTQSLFPDPQEARVLGLAADVLELRLIDRLRAAEGATYSPGLTSITSEVFPGYGYVAFQVETPPAKIAGVFAEVDSILTDLALHGPTPDEMDRAKRPRVEQRIKTQLTNEYWLGSLIDADVDPRRLEIIRDLVPGNQKITADDVKAAVARFLRPEREWRLVVRSPDPAPGAPIQTPIGSPNPPRAPTVEPGRAPVLQPAPPSDPTAPQPATAKPTAPTGGAAATH